MASRKGRPINNRVLYRYLIRSMKVPVTIHGFRSSFRDWAGNETHFDRVTCELALAHRAGDATELAYRRSDISETPRIDGRVVTVLRLIAPQREPRGVPFCLLTEQQI
jgi:hypothetical protein